MDRQSDHRYASASVRTLAVALACSAPGVSDAQLSLNVDFGVDPAASATSSREVPTEMRAAITAGADVWERCLGAFVSEPLSITVHAEGSDTLPCTADNQVAATGAPATVFLTDGRTLPGPLAAQAGYPVSSSAIELRFNAAFAAPNRCGGLQWSTTIAQSNGETLPAPSVFAATLHELSHGLGLALDLDAAVSGANSSPSVYLSQTFSLAHQRELSELTPAELYSAVTTPKNVVWTGSFTRIEAAATLTAGVPTLYLEHASALTPLLDENIAADPGTPLQVNVTGQLAIVAGSELCAGSLQVEGSFVATKNTPCDLSDIARNAAALGAKALLVGVPSQVPQLPEDWLASPIPLVLVSNAAFADLEALQENDVLRLYFDFNRRLGADPSGRPYLYTPIDYNPGTTLTHLDPLTAGSQIATAASMTPGLGARFDESCGFALSLLLDLGWANPRCGDGVVDAGEQCDDGAKNSNRQADRCRHDCVTASCGDAVVDKGEDCDQGVLNAQAPDACRPNCTRPRCGDGIVDWLHGEQCDAGSANSNDSADTCRVTCELPRCGDGVIDTGEACDDGQANSNDAPNACRTNCSPPRCGDGIVDSAYGETCDDGNSLDGPRCDSQCHAPAPTNPSSAVDDGGLYAESRTPPAEVRPDAALARHDASVRDAAAADAMLARTAQPDDAPASKSATADPQGGCQCRTTGQTGSPKPGWFLVCGLGLWLWLPRQRGCRTRNMTHLARQPDVR